jgi:hypothetical protein
MTPGTRAEYVLKRELSAFTLGRGVPRDNQQLVLDPQFSLM